jgi:ubiquitin C-terminal hydrolase
MTEAPVYSLFAVITHSGSVQAGHYYSFIRPNMNPDDPRPDTRDTHHPRPDTHTHTHSDWYKFDDEQVYTSSLRPQALVA